MVDLERAVDLGQSVPRGVGRRIRGGVDGRFPGRSVPRVRRVGCRGPVRRVRWRRLRGISLCGNARPWRSQEQQDRTNDREALDPSPARAVRENQRARPRANSTNIPTGTPVGPRGIVPRSVSE